MIVSSDILFCQVSKKGGGGGAYRESMRDLLKGVYYL